MRWGDQGLVLKALVHLSWLRICHVLSIWAAQGALPEGDSEHLIQPSLESSSEVSASLMRELKV